MFSVLDYKIDDSSTWSCCEAASSSTLETIALFHVQIIFGALLNRLNYRLKLKIKWEDWCCDDAIFKGFVQ